MMIQVYIYILWMFSIKNVAFDIEESPEDNNATGMQITFSIGECQFQVHRLVGECKIDHGK